MLVTGSVVVSMLALAVVLISSGDDPDATTLVAEGDGSIPKPGEPAPDFDLPGLEGGRVRLADYRGRPVILTFFARWCHPCSQEIPHLNDALAEHADEELAVLGISYRDIERDSISFLDELGASWPAAKDPDGVAADAYGVRNIPVTFFIDRDGTVDDLGFGLTSKDDVDEYVDRLLGHLDGAPS